MEDMSEKILVAAGWYPNRNICLVKIRFCLYTNGLQMPSKVKAFLKEFGKLFVYSDSNTDRELIHFDPCKALREVDVSWVKEYSLRIGCEELCAIGQADKGYTIICMDEKGNFYLGYDDLLYFISGDIRDFIHKVYSNVKGTEIP